MPTWLITIKCQSLENHIGVDIINKKIEPHMIRAKHLVLNMIEKYY
tara:strand:- start:304 stop:441 length:138 start_codon:yes stop_codon:yes gene_type:complete